MDDVLAQESGGGSAAPNNPMQVNNVNDAATSINQGVSMLSQYYKETGGNVGWTLAMYNMGQGIYSWAKSKGITDPATAMQEFAQAQGGNYGDPNYINHVLSHG